MATFRLRKSGGGSTVRGGDTSRFGPDTVAAPAAVTVTVTSPQAIPGGDSGVAPDDIAIAVTVPQATPPLSDSTATPATFAVTVTVGASKKASTQPVLARAKLVLQAQEYAGTGDWLDQTGNGHDATNNGAKFLGWDIGQQYVYFPGVDSNYCSVPDSAALSVTGDIDIRIKLAMDDWTPALTQVLFSKDQSALRSWVLDMPANGRPRFSWSEDGTTVATVQATAATGFTDAEAHWLRVTLDVNGGSGGIGRATFYTSSDDTYSWTQLGSVQDSGASAPTSIDDNASNVEIGSNFDGTSTLAGKVYRAQIYDGIDGTLELDIDFTNRTTVVEPFATFTESSTNAATVTFNRSGTSNYITTLVDRPMWILDGSDDYLAVADHSDLDPGALGDFAVMFAGRIYDATPAANSVFAAKKTGTGTAAGYALWVDTAGAAYAEIGDGTDDANDNKTTALTAGQGFVHTGVRNVSDDDIETFIDGTGTGTPTTDDTTATLANAEELRLGRYSGAGANYLQGEIHAVAFWREALTDTDVAAAGTELLYLSGTSAAFDDDVSLSIDIAFDSNPLSETALWTDVTSDVRSFATKSGRSHELDRIAPSTASVVLSNASGNYDPTNAAGVHSPNVRPMKQIRIKVTHNHTRYDLFHGLITAWPQAWPQQKDAVAVAKAVDGMNLLNAVFTSTAEAAENSSTRVGNLLDDAEWPTTWRNLNTGDITLQAHTPACENVLRLVRTVEDSEAGLFFIDGKGWAQFQERSYRAGLSDVATFGDAAAELGYTDLQLGYDETQIWNRIEISRVGGAQQTAENVASQAAFGKRTLKYFDLLHNSDADALTFAEAILARYKDPGIRIESLTIMPRQDATNLWPEALGRELSDLVTVKRRPPAGNTITETVHIEGVAHRADARNKSWTTTFHLSPYQ
jgi:hypothetical protein